MDKFSRLAPMRWHPLAIVMAMVSLPLLVVHAWFGTPDGSSAYYNLAWAEGFDAAFWDGETYPRRLDTLLAGKGGLDFFFYGPLPFWLNSTLGRALCGGCSAVEAFPLTGAILILLSGPAFYALARRFAAPWASAIGAGIYMLLPYHMLADWWLRQAVGEVAAFIFTPLLLLGAKRILDGERGVLIFALALAGLVLSHLPSVMIMGYFLAGYCALRAWQKRAEPMALLRPGFRLAGAGLLGLALSAVYWLPAIALLDDVSPDALYNAYANPLNWLFLDGRAAPNPVTATWTALLYMAAMIVAVAAWWVLRGREQAALGWIAGTVGFAVLMASLPSAPLWAYTPIAAVQFPWRTLMVADLGLGLAAAALAGRVLAHAAARAGTDEAGTVESGDVPDRRRLRIGALVSAGAVMVAAGLMLPMVATTAGGVTSGNRAPMPTGALEYMPGPFLAAVRAIEAEMPDPQPGENPYPRWFRAIETAGKRLDAASSASSSYYHVETFGTRRIHIDLETRRFGQIILPWPYWRHWQVTDRKTGEALDLLVHAETGGMAINGGPGRLDIALVLKPLPAERQGAWLSGLSAVLLLAMALRSLLGLRLTGGGVTRPEPA